MASALLSSADTGAALEPLFGTFLTAVLQVKNGHAMFRSILESLENTLKSIEPAIKRIDSFNEDFDRINKIEALKEMLRKGNDLVGKCSKVRKYDFFNKPYYTKKLVKLVENLRKFTSINLQVHQSADIKENLFEVKQLGDQLRQSSMEQSSMAAICFDAASIDCPLALSSLLSPPTEFKNLQFQHAQLQYSLDACLANLAEQNVQLNARLAYLAEQNFQLNARIADLAEQNVQFGSLACSLSYQVKERELELKEKFEMELKKHTDEAASKVAEQIVQVNVCLADLAEQNVQLGSLVCSLSDQIANIKDSSVRPSVSTSEVCPICLTNGKDLAFNCGHMTCQDCGSRVSNCPICRRSITNRLKLFTG